MTQTTSEMNVDIRSILYCLEEMKEQLRIESEKRETMEGRISALENDLKTEKERTRALEIRVHMECEEKDCLVERVSVLENELKTEKERTRALEIRVHMDCEEKEFMEGRITALENELSAFEIRIVAQAFETGKLAEQRLSLLENWTGEKIKEEEQNDAVLIGYNAGYNKYCYTQQGVLQYHTMVPIYANKHVMQRDFMAHMIGGPSHFDIIINIEALHKLPNVRNIDIQEFIHTFHSNSNSKRAIIVKHNGQVVLTSREFNYSPDYVSSNLPAIHLFSMATMHFKFKKQILDLLVVYPDLFTTNLEHCELFKTLHIIT